MRHRYCLLRRSSARAALALIAGLLAFPTAAAAHEPLVVFFVRHAEKVDASRDPALSAAGHARAERLAALLADAGVEHIHSSDFVRTRDTAAPLAEARGLEVERYDHRDLPALIARMREAGGRHLVVGHSNTTPAAVALLGGDPGPEIDEAREYDRLYLVTVAADGTVATVVLRYGAPSPRAGGDD